MSILRDEVLHTMDEDLMIGQVGWPTLPKGLEGGDTINRMSHYLFLLGINKELGYPIAAMKELPWRFARPALILARFESKEWPGEFVRHYRITASPHGWVAYVNGHYQGVLSRDQFISLLICLGYHNEHEMLWRIVKAHFRRGFLFTNNTLHNGDDPKTAKQKIVGDVTGPEVLAAYLRGFSTHRVVKWFKPLIWIALTILDVETFLGSLYWPLRYKRKEGKWKMETDIINHASVIIYGMQRMTTLTMWFAAKILSAEFVMVRLAKYWHSWRESPYFINLYALPVSKSFRLRRQKVVK